MAIILPRCDHDQLNEYWKKVSMKRKNFRNIIIQKRDFMQSDLAVSVLSKGERASYYEVFWFYATV